MFNKTEAVWRWSGLISSAVHDTIEAMKAQNVQKDAGAQILVVVLAHIIDDLETGFPDFGERLNRELAARLPKRGIIQ